MSRKAATTVAAAVDSLWPPATADQLGRLLGISGRRCRELATEGVFSRAAGGRYPVEACVHAYLQMLRSAAKAKPAPDPTTVHAAIDGRQQRARLARLQADRVELELERERGRLVDAETIRIAYVGLVTAARNRLLGVPSEAKGKIPHLTVDEIEILEDLIVTALERVAEGAEDDETEEEA